MPSSLSWLDHSDRERRRVLEAIERFKETETRDELGLGSIRDAFADRFFPGTSVVQTRARYFLFTPWMYQQFEAEEVSSSAIAAKARRLEVKLIEALLASDDNDGTLGRNARATLKRLPSNVYWQGLGAWGIRTFDGSQDEYHRSLDQAYERRRRAVLNDDSEFVEGGPLRHWHPGLPPPPATFPDKASFLLRRNEAEYLRARIAEVAPGSLLAFLVRQPKHFEVEWPWEHPLFGSFPEPLRDALEHARLFAETMHGTALLYNLMLAEELPAGESRESAVAKYRGRIEAWCEELQAREPAVSSWDRVEFWKLVGEHAVRGATHRFVEEWLDHSPWSEAKQALDSPELRKLLRARELQLKRGRARLGNPRALELWSGAAGVGRLNYRWPTAQDLLRDIHDGLRQSRNAHA